MTTDKEKSKRLYDLVWNKRMELMNKYHRTIPDNELSKILGVSNASLNSWINGNRLPNYDNIVQLSKTFGTEIFVIFEEEPVISSNDPQLIFLIDHWRELSDNLKQDIILTIEEKTGAKYMP